MLTIQQLIKFIRNTRDYADDEIAVMGKELYPKWENFEVGDTIDANRKVIYEGQLYKCTVKTTVDANFPTDNFTCLEGDTDESNAN